MIIPWQESVMVPHRRQNVLVDDILYGLIRLALYWGAITNNDQGIPKFLHNYKYGGTNNLQHNRCRLHSLHIVLLAWHYPDICDHYHRTDPIRTRFPKIPNTIHLWCQHLVRGRHSSHYDCLPLDRR